MKPNLTVVLLPPAKFPLGQVVATPGAINLIERHDAIAETFLQRHQAGDWGTMCAEDCMQNDAGLDSRDPGRLHSSYDLGGETLWIITEWDRSVTTLLLPEEY